MNGLREYNENQRLKEQNAELLMEVETLKAKCRLLENQLRSYEAARNEDNVPQVPEKLPVEHYRVRCKWDGKVHVLICDANLRKPWYIPAFDESYFSKKDVEDNYEFIE